MSASEFYAMTSGLADPWVKKWEDDAAKKAVLGYADSVLGLPPEQAQPGGLAALGRAIGLPPESTVGKGLAALGNIIMPQDQQASRPQVPSPSQPVQSSPNLGRAASAIAGIESGGNYNSLGPVTSKGDRALGKYQVMSSNIPQWSQEILGRSVTPQEFLANPQLQDAIFKGKFGQYVQKYGPEGAARAWFAGEGGMNNPNAKDQLGTTVASYANQFNQGYGAGAPAQAAIAQAAPPQRAVPGGAMAYTAAGQPVPTDAQGRALNPDGTPTGPAGVSTQPSTSPSTQQGLASIPASPPVQMAQAQQQQPQQRFTPQESIALRQMIANPQTRAAALQIIQQRANPTYGFQTLPDGTIIRTDPRNGTVQPIYQSNLKPTYGVIGKDQFGNEQYGWIDPQTRQVTPSNAPQSAAVTQAPAQSGSPPADGIPPAPPGVDPKVWRAEQTKQLAQGDKYTEAQSKDALYADRIREAEPILSDPAVVAAMMNPVDIAKSKIPGIGNSLVSVPFQKADQASRNFINAVLRKESGAVISDAEFANARKQYLPEYGDSPEKLAQKAQNRATALAGIARGGGPSYQKQQQAKPSGPPKAGAVEDGYRFKGGDPSNPSSWVKVN